MLLLDFLFDDKRAATFLLVVWILVVCGTLQTLDLLHSEFMTCGPTPHTRFMTVTIDTWPRWWLLALATFFNTCVTDFMTDAIAPWLQNTMQDHKTRFLPYHKLTCYVIYQVWTIYMSVMSLFSVALIMSQIDFLLIRLAADLLVNTFTAFKFMRNKTPDSRKYSAWFEEELVLAHEFDSLNSDLENAGSACGNNGVVFEPPSHSHRKASTATAIHRNCNEAMNRLAKSGRKNKKRKSEMDVNFASIAETCLKHDVGDDYSYDGRIFVISDVIPEEVEDDSNKISGHCLKDGGNPVPDTPR